MKALPDPALSSSQAACSQVYIYTAKPAGHRIKVWFDDVVVAAEYIGPLAKP